MICNFGETQRLDGVYTCSKCGVSHRSKSWPIARACHVVALGEASRRRSEHSCNCPQRQAFLNKISGPIRLGDKVAAVANPIRRAWVRATTPPPRVLFRYPHGLGDAVQFSAVLKHLRYYYPHHRFDVAVAAGRSQMLSHLARNAFVDDATPGASYEIDRAIFCDEPGAAGYAEHPSCKTAWTLRHVFAVQPRAELFAYDLHWNDSHRGEVAKFLIQNGLQEKRYIVVHYQGVSKTRYKNLGEEFAARICRDAIRRGLVPVVLDYSRQSTIRVPGVLFVRSAEQLRPEGSVFCALADWARACFGIDSGPGHCFGARQLSTPTLLTWGKHFPGCYYWPAPHVLHLVPGKYRRHAPNDAALGYFWENYRYAISPGTTDLILPELAVAIMEAAPGVVDRLARGYRRGRWVGTEYDVGNVLDQIPFRPDAWISCGVGQPPHCEAEQAADRWPGIRCYGWEPDAKAAGLQKHFPGPIRPLGLWDVKATLDFHPVSDMGQSSFLPGISGRVPDTLPAVRVKVETFDSVWGRAVEPFARGVLWLDAEGSELRILRGVRGALEAGRIGAVFAEISTTPRRLGEPTAADLDAFLAGYGFRPAWDRPGTEHSWDRLWVRG